MVQEIIEPGPFGALRSGLSWIIKAKSGASAIAQTLLTQVTLLVMSLCTGIISARALGVSGRGQLAAIILWPQVLAGLFAFGVPAALVFHARRAPSEERALFHAAISLSVLASLIMLVAGAISIPQALHAYSQSTIADALVFLLVAPQVLISYVLVAHLQVRGAFSGSNAFRFLPAAATLLGLIFFASSKSLTPQIAAACYLLPSIPVFLVVLFQSFRSASGPKSPILPAAKKILNFATRASGIDLLGTLSSQVDQLMVVSFLDPASMGAYVVALSVSRAPNVIVSATVQVVSPRAASLSGEALTELVGRCTRIAAGSMLAVGLAIAAVLPLVLPHLFGHDFVRSIASARILLLELLLTGTATMLAEAFKGIGRPGAVTLLQALSLTSSIVLLLILVPRFGLIGASFALLCAALIRLTALLLVYRRIVGTRPPALILGLGDIRFVASVLRSQLARAA